MYDDTFCVRIATDHSIIIGLIQVKPKSSREYRYYMEFNGAILFEELLERVLHPVDCTGLDNFFDNSLSNNYSLCNAETHMEIMMKGKYDNCKRLFNMTYEICECLIKAIRNKIEILKKFQVGTCLFCDQIIYKDNTRYVQADGTVVHGYCMEIFIASDRADEVKLPVKIFRPVDCFGFIEHFGESHRFSLFPKRRVEG